MIESYDVFISYSSRDETLATDLYHEMQKLKVHCFLAKKELKVSAPWRKEIASAMDNSKIALFLMTKSAKESEWVLEEIGAAWMMNKRIITLLRDIKETEIPVILRDYQLREYNTSKQMEDVWQEISGIVDLSSFWNNFLRGVALEESVYIALSTKIGKDYIRGEFTGQSGHTFLVSYNEFNAALQIKEVIENIRENVEIIHGGVIVGKDNKANEIIEMPAGWERRGIKEKSLKQECIIVLGSSHANQVCRSLAEKLFPLPYQFESRQRSNGKKEKIITTRSNDVFPRPNEKTEKLSGNRLIVIKDYGIIMQVTNPFDKEGKHKILMLGGNHGPGTEASIEYALNPKYIQDLRKHIGDSDFAAIFMANFHEQKLTELTLKEITKYDAEANKWGPGIRLV